MNKENIKRHIGSIKSWIQDINTLKAFEGKNKTERSTNDYLLVSSIRSAKMYVHDNIDFDEFLQNKLGQYGYEEFFQERYFETDCKEIISLLKQDLQEIEKAEGKNCPPGFKAKNEYS